MLVGFSIGMAVATAFITIFPPPSRTASGVVSVIFAIWALIEYALT